MIRIDFENARDTGDEAPRRGYVLNARIVKTEIEAFVLFLLFINEYMIRKIVKRANKKCKKFVKRLMLTKFLFVIVTQTKKK